MFYSEFWEYIMSSIPVSQDPDQYQSVVSSEREKRYLHSIPVA